MTIYNSIKLVDRKSLVHLGVLELIDRIGDGFPNKFSLLELSGYFISFFKSCKISDSSDTKSCPNNVIGKSQNLS